MPLAERRSFVLVKSKPNAQRHTAELFRKLKIDRRIVNRISAKQHKRFDFACLKITH